MGKQKLSKVVTVETKKFEDVSRTTNHVTIKQEHQYKLDCGHRAFEVVHVGKEPKARMRCKACAGVANG